MFWEGRKEVGERRCCTKHLVLFGESVLSSSCCQCLQPSPSPVPVQSHLPAGVAAQQLWAQSLETEFSLSSKLPLYRHNLSRVAKIWVLFRIRNTEPQKTVKSNRGWLSNRRVHRWRLGGKLPDFRRDFCTRGKQGHRLLRTACCASATKQFKEAVKWLQCIKYL